MSKSDMVGGDDDVDHLLLSFWSGCQKGSLLFFGNDDSFL